MVAPAHPAALHWLTPGSPTYTLLKLGAVGGLIALRMAMARRAREARKQREDAPAGHDE